MTPTSPDPLDEILGKAVWPREAPTSQRLYASITFKEAKTALTAWKDQAVRDALLELERELPEERPGKSLGNLAAAEFAHGFNDACRAIKALIQQKVGKHE